MFSAFRNYWSTYGGVLSILISPYFWLALVISVLLNPLWVSDLRGAARWPNLAFSILPSMIGFSMGAIAIFVSLSSGNFMRVIASGSPSYFMRVSAAFFHFLLLQIIAIFMALFFVAWGGVWLSFTGFFFFSYAILSGVAAAAALFDLAEIKNASEE